MQQQKIVPTLMNPIDTPMGSRTLKNLLNC